MRVQLSDHFTFGRLFRFVISPIVMMIFTSVYGIVDGFFVSNFVGKNAFAAINLIIPVSMGFAAVGFMLGTGGSAIIAKTLGEGKRDLANRYFSLMIFTAAALGILFSLLSFAFTPQLARALGAQDELLSDCITYGRILFGLNFTFILQTVLQNFLVTAEKPGLSLGVSVAAGVTNIVLDWLLIAVFKLGVAGAALATVLGQAVGAFVPLVYFMRKNDSLLRLVKPAFKGAVLKNACLNGSSEMVTNLSTSVVNVLYNFQLMKLVGADGVAAYGVIMYVNFVFMAVFFGYSLGSAPIVSYHYGAYNHSELKNLFKKSLLLMGVGGMIMTVLGEILTVPLVTIFAGYDEGLFEMTCRGFRLYSPCFMFMGINVWASSFFTALNNGAVSAAISFLRTLFFQIVTVLLLPLILGLDGIWLSVVMAEFLTLFVTGWFLVKNRGKYKYI